MFQHYGRCRGFELKGVQYTAISFNINGLDNMSCRIAFCVIALFSIFAASQLAQAGTYRFQKSSDGSYEILGETGWATSVIVLVDEQRDEGLAYIKNLFNKQTFVTGQLIGCKDIVLLPVGTANGNKSYGAECFLKKDDVYANVFICGDDMVGRNTIKLYGNSYDKLTYERLKERTSDVRSIAGYIKHDCFGG